MSVRWAAVEHEKKLLQITITAFERKCTRKKTVHLQLYNIIAVLRSWCATILQFLRDSLSDLF